jgi:hypothetical protein
MAHRADLGKLLKPLLDQFVVIFHEKPLQCNDDLKSGLY